MYSDRIDQALAFVADKFRNEMRKGTGIPYLTHLLQVATWVWEYGGDENQVIAALLHDYLEDIEGATEDEVKGLFGDDVAHMVVALSDSTTHPKPPWKERKVTYLARLREKDERTKLVSCSDKLHNATSIQRDLKTLGEELWGRFKGKKDGTLWYYAEVVDALGDGWDHALLERLRLVVQEIHDEA